MPSLTHDQFDALIREHEELVRKDREAAIAKLHRLIRKVDVIYAVLIALSVTLFVAGIVLLFGSFSHSVSVLWGLIFSTLGVLILMGSLGIDPHRQDAPEQIEPISRSDFPELFSLLDSICVRLDVPRWETVLFKDDRNITVMPHGVTGTKPKWSLHLGTRYLLEASAAEFEWEILKETALFAGEHYTLYRNVYERMQRRAIVIKIFPSLAVSYWSAWAIAKSLVYRFDSEAYRRAKELGDARWAGSKLYRAMTGPFVSDLPKTILKSQLAISHSQLPEDFCKRVQDLGLIRIPLRKDLLKQLIEVPTEGRDAIQSGMTHLLFREGFEEREIFGNRFGELTDLMAQQDGPTVIDRYFKIGTRANVALTQYLRKAQTKLWRVSRSAVLEGLDTRDRKGIEPETLSPEECYGVLHLIAAEVGVEAAIQYGNKALEFHKDDPWILFILSGLEFRLNPGGFPEFATRMRKASVLWPLLKTHIDNWKGFFPHVDADWGEPLGEFDRIKRVDYVAAILPQFWKQFWIDQAKEHADISALIACRGVDHNGIESQMIVAVLRRRSFQLKPPYFLKQIQDRFEEDGFANFWVIESDSPWVAMIRRNHPEFFIYGK